MIWTVSLKSSPIIFYLSSYISESSEPVTANVYRPYVYKPKIIVIKQRTFLGEIVITNITNYMNEIPSWQLTAFYARKIL
jgi:hypothetical protein